MRQTTRRVVGVLVALSLGSIVGATSCADEPPSRDGGELDTRRLTGRAHYENDDYAAAAAEFRRCIELAPESAADQFNLGLSLMRGQKYTESLAALAAAGKLDPELLAVHYVRGIIHKREARFELAVEALEWVVERDPDCRGAYYNLGVCYKYLDRHQDAVTAFKHEEKLSPDGPSTQYQLMTLYRLLGDAENAARHRERFDRVNDTVDQSQKTPEALERSKYTQVIDVPRLAEDLSPRPDRKLQFVDATEAFGLPEPGTHCPGPAAERLAAEVEEGRFDPSAIATLLGNGLTLGDYDGDGDLDLYVVNAWPDEEHAVNRLYRNEGSGTFVDVTEAAGVGDAGMGCDAVFGDYDNDGDVDLYVANYGPNTLYRNRGDGTFEDVSAEARVNEPQFGYQVALIDYDHDNDLDIYIANLIDLPWPPEHRPAVDKLGSQSNTLLRNNGDGTFWDQTDAAGLLVGFEQTHDLVYGDFDGDHDLDIFEVSHNAKPRFFANARLGTFVEGGRFDPPIPIQVTALADGDFNRDGHMDLVLATGESSGSIWLYTNDGSAAFSGVQVPIPGTLSGGGILQLLIADFNNDGWNDILAAGWAPPHLLAGTGPGQFRDVTENVGLPTDHYDRLTGAGLNLTIGDLDGDGDQDIIAHTLKTGPVILRNDGGNRGNWINVKLVGKKVNKSGYGAAVEVASGGHYQKQTYREGPVHFGLGNLESVDVVRVTWPNGVAQNVIRPKINADLTIEEVVKVSASCAFLYAYNGRGFELVNEILGIGPLGVPMGPGVYHQPDCTELTMIEASQLVAKDGMYELRLTEELRETAYADQITLRVVDRPAELEVVPNEFFTAPPFPEDKLFAIGDGRLPRSAVDHRGRDVLDLVRYRDGRFPTFALTGYDGLAQSHSLTLDLGNLAGAPQVLLFLDGWIYWPESSVVMAIAQDPRFEISPLRLEVRDGSGNWHTAIESVGLPTSKGSVVPVDLTGRFLCDDYTVRLSTNLCIYFDRIFISTGDQAARCRQTELPVARADLRYRGFSRMTRDALGYERFDYAEVSPTGSWSPPAGMLTRYGDVTQLLAAPDDRYVIFGPGDELSLRFDASGLPRLPPGWTRDFVFYANGWVKDGDLNTRFSDTVEPLPFHGMSGYPYGAEEHYPDTPQHRRYLDTYNRRPSRSTVGPLVGPNPPKR